VQDDPEATGQAGLIGILVVSDEISAERVGFEPTVAVTPRRFSRPLQSSALAPLRRTF
jgi:hypothetical protein